jgi:hypothetical protein
MSKRAFRPEKPTEQHRKTVVDTLCQLVAAVGMVRASHRKELSVLVCRSEDLINAAGDRVRGNRPASFPMGWEDLDLFLTGAARDVLEHDHKADAPAPPHPSLVRLAQGPSAEGTYERPPSFVIEDAWQRFMHLCCSCAAIRHNTSEAVHAWGAPIQEKAIGLWTEMASRVGGPTWAELQDVMKASVALLHEAMKE